MNSNNFNLFESGNDISLELHQGNFSFEHTLDHTPMDESEDSRLSCYNFKDAVPFKQEASHNWVTVQFGQNGIIGNESESEEKSPLRAEMKDELLAKLDNQLKTEKECKIKVQKCAHSEIQDIILERNCEVIGDDDSQNSDDEERKGPRKGGRKPIETGLSKRKDVILKKVLRTIRTYYWKAFNQATKYCIRKRRRNNESFYYQCINDYIETILKIDADTFTVKTLGDFLCMNPNRKSKENEYYDVLYRFSFAKFKNLTSNKRFCALIKIYGEITDKETLSSDEKIGLQMLINEC